MTDRRSFLRGLTIAGAASILNIQRAQAEAPPETTRIRLGRLPDGVDVACLGPMWMAEELLRAEGFSAVEYVSYAGELDVLAAGRQDIILYDAPGLILAIDDPPREYALKGFQRPVVACSIRGLKSVEI